MEQYVSNGEPVGSKSVCEDLDMLFSSATIRNEMAKLVENGYLTQPHVSAGRVPSHQGYRLYINRLMPKKLLSLQEIDDINSVLKLNLADPEQLLDSAAKILSAVTNCIAIVTTPPADESRVRDIQFVLIGRRSAMLVLMTSDGRVKNKLFRCKYDLNADILHMFTEILNSKFRGERLKDITPEFVSILVDNDRELAFLLLPVIDVLIQTAKEAQEIEVKIHGQKNLLQISEISAEDVVNVFSFLEEKGNIVKLLTLSDYGIKFVVGNENSYIQLKNSSVISTHYNVGGKFGTIGIIGPTRMDYSNVSAQLQYVASVVGVMLGRALEN